MKTPAAKDDTKPQRVLKAKAPFGRRFKTADGKQPRKPLPGDRALREKAQTRPAQNGIPLIRSSDGLHFECPTCGRQWRVVGSHTGRMMTSDHGRAAGFVAVAARNHYSTCLVATPEEWRAIARLDMARWDRNPPVQSVEINYGHPGYGNEPIWPVSES